MKITIIRKWFTTNASIGELYVDDTLFCFTLEDTVRALGVKIKGHTAIPAGKYSVKLTFSNRFQQNMPLISNSSDLSVQDGFGARWDGIRIHPGNTDKDTDGCILLGRKRLDTSIVESKAAYSLFMEQYLKEKYADLTVLNKQMK